MRVAIDYTPAVRQAAGIGRLTRHLVREVVALDSTNRYCLFVAGQLDPSSSHAADWPPHVDLVSTFLAERLLTIAWHRLRLPIPIEAFVGNCDIFHSTDFVLPPVASARTILTVHDLSFLRFPECVFPRLRAYLSTAVPRSLARADHVLADSAATRQDLIDLLGVAPERISIVYGGIEERFTPDGDVEQDQRTLERYQINDPYILSVGTIEPRKNYVRLIQAYHQLCQTLDDLPILVIAGGKGWIFAEAFELVGRLKLGKQIRFLGYVADEDLPALYRRAHFFAFPSLYEGFGFPPLEAMACGCPVVCSETSSMPEVVGDAAITFDPSDIDAIANAILHILHDSTLQKELAARGPARAAHFTWPAAARSLLAEYEQILAKES